MESGFSCFQSLRPSELRSVLTSSASTLLTCAAVNFPYQPRSLSHLTNDCALHIGGVPDVASSELICEVDHLIRIPNCVQLNGPLNVALGSRDSFNKESGAALADVQYAVVSAAEDSSQFQGWIDFPGLGAVAVASSSESVVVYFDSNSFVREYATHLELSIEGVLRGQVDPRFNYVNISSRQTVEAGTYFISLTPVYASSGGGSVPTLRGVSFGCALEVVPLQLERLFVDPVESDSLAPEPVDSASLPDVRVCVWGNAHMDGQKTVWLQQTRGLSALSAMFAFTWILTRDEETDARALLSQLAALPRVTVVDSPLNSFLVAADEWASAVHASPARVHGTDGNASLVYAFIRSRWEEAGGDIDKVSPEWCFTMFDRVRTVLRESACSVLVFGNQRGGGADTVLVSAAASLRIPTVAELLSPDLHPLAVPDVLVAPSEFAARHHSVRSEASTPVLVIPPSVDPAVFYSRRASRAIRSPEAAFIVGFVGRLAPEKSPGLFLLLARALSERYPSIRFVLIGDGVVRPMLERLASLLGIANRLTFTGWLSDKLPSVLSMLDIVVNTSLRGTSETFCLSNIEVMALGIPLVTFAVGGIGQYIRQPSNCDAAMSFCVASNGVIVNRAELNALVDAVVFLVDNRDERERIGTEGARVVKHLFSVDRQIRKYFSLYTNLVLRSRV